MTIYRKRQDGDRLQMPAAFYNELVDALEYIRRLKSRSGVLEKQWPGRGVLVRNNSGTGRAAFDVLGIDDPVIVPADNENEFCWNLAIDGSLPQIETHEGKICVLIEPIASGAIGRGIIDGMTPARLYVTAESDIFADVNDGTSANLSTDLWGSARILWKVGGTGSQWGIVALGAGELTPWYEADLTAALAQGGTATANVTIGASTREITVTDRFLATGDSLASGARVGVQRDFLNQRWTVVQATCS